MIKWSKKKKGREAGRARERAHAHTHQHRHTQTHTFHNSGECVMEKWLESCMGMRPISAAAMPMKVAASMLSGTLAANCSCAT